MKIRSKYLSLLATSIFVISISSLCFLIPARLAYAAEDQIQQSELEQQMAPKEREAFQALTPEQRADFRSLMSILRASQKGPAKINLLDQANFSLPENDIFIPSKAATDFQRLIKEPADHDIAGIIVSKDLNFNWYITVEFDKSGYIRDDDANSLDADNLLKVIKENTERANKTRIANGSTPLEIVGWVEAPNYDASMHRLTFSILAKEDSKDQTVNYRQILLGREGIFVFNLVSLNSQIAATKLYSQEITKSLHYDTDKRYADFNEGTDRVAKYGLAALITGIAAKKLGLLALAGAFLVKMWKLIFLLPVIFWGAIKKIFKGKSPAEKSE